MTLPLVLADWDCDCICGGPCLYWSDDFDRADNDDPGANWTEIDGDWDVESTELVTRDSNAYVKSDKQAIWSSYLIKTTIPAEHEDNRSRILVENTKYILEVQPGHCEATNDPPWYNIHWYYRMKITVQQDNLDENLSDFPLAVLIFDPDNDVTPFCRDDGWDIRFTAIDGVTLLPQDRRWFDKASSPTIGLFYVRTDPVAAPGGAYEFYMYYGYLGAPDGNTDPAAVWNDQYVAVYHEDEDAWGGVAGEVEDIKQGLNGTAAGNATTAVTEYILYRSGVFDGDGDYITVPDDIAFDVVNLTIETWMFPILDPDDPSGIAGCLVARDAESAQADRYFSLTVESVGGSMRAVSRLYGATTTSTLVSTMVIAADFWYHVAATYDGTTHRLYIDGAEEDSEAWAGPLNTGDEQLSFGRLASGQDWHGYLDEARLSSADRSAAWLKFQVANWTEPDNELTWGEPESITRLTYCGKMRLFYDSGVSEVLYASRTLTADYYETQPGVRTFTACVGNDMISAESGNDILSIPKPATISGVVGLATVTVASGEKARFDDFEIWKHEDFDPTCPPCTPSCTYFLDEFCSASLSSIEWDTAGAIGTWAIDTDVAALECTTDNAVLWCNCRNPATLQAGGFPARLTIYASVTTSVLTDNVATAKVFFSGSTGNYVKIEFNGCIGGGSSADVSIYGGGALLGEPIGTISGSGCIVTLRIYLDADQVSVGVRIGSPNFTTFTRAFVAGSDLFGLGTGSAGSGVLFNSVSADWHEDNDPDCDPSVMDCTALCCENSLAPNSLWVDLEGFGYDTKCLAACQSLDGSYECLYLTGCRWYYYSDTIDIVVKCAQSDTGGKVWQVDVTGVVGTWPADCAILGYYGSLSGNEGPFDCTALDITRSLRLQGTDTPFVSYCPMPSTVRIYAA